MSTIPPIESPPYAVYCDYLRDGKRCMGHVERVYDFEVALRIMRHQHGWALRNEWWCTDGEAEFGGLTKEQIEAVMAAGWPWTGVSQVSL